MPIASNIQSHQSYLGIWNQALSSPNGLSLTVPDEAQAHDLRMRLYHARKAQRKENRKIYPADHPMHNNSFFDDYTIRIRLDDYGRWVVRIEKSTGIELLEVNEL